MEPPRKHSWCRRMGEGRGARAARCVADASRRIARASEPLCLWATWGAEGGGGHDVLGTHVLGRLNIAAISIQTRLVTSRL